MRTALKEGDTLAAQSRWDEALDKYMLVAEQAPQNKEYRLKVEKAKYEASLIHIKKGEEFLQKRDFDRGLMEFQVASSLNPSLRKAKDLADEAKKRKDADYYYRTGLDFEKSGKKNEARAAFKRALSLDPSRSDAIEAIGRVKDEKKATIGGYELNLKSDKPITLKFKDTAITDVFDIISKLSGINFILDEGVKKQKTSIYLEDATFEQALDLVLMTNQLFQKVVNENTMIIIPDTKQKRQQYEELLIHTFYLSNLDAKKAVNLLRTLLQIRSIYVNEDLNTIIVRDTPEVIDLAEKILQANDLADAEVMLEVEILEIQKNASENLGAHFSKDTITAGLGTLDKDDTLTYEKLKRFSRSDMLFTIPDLVINIQKNEGKANILANPKIRVLNKKKAKIHIGDRVPIITSTVNNGVTTENVQYVDIGVKLNVEPEIHLDNDVTLKINLEISSLGSETKTSQSTVYQIGTRNAETELRLHDGETQVIGGLISDTERETLVKIPFLGDIPVIGRLFSSAGNSKDKTEIVLSITPHITKDKEIADAEYSSVWSGTEQGLSSRAPFASFTEQDPAVDLPLPGTEGSVSVSPPSTVVGGFAVPRTENTENLESEQPTGQQPPQPTSTVANLPPAGGPASFIIDGPPSVSSGEEFTLSLSLRSDQNVVSIPFYLRYDAALVSFVRAVEGGFLKGDGKPTAFMTSNDAKNGRVIVGSSRLGDQTGISGTGTVMTVTFKATGGGNARFYLENFRITGTGGTAVSTTVNEKTIQIL